jgi:hypothetical protein
MKHKRIQLKRVRFDEDKVLIVDDSEHEGLMPWETAPTMSGIKREDNQPFTIFGRLRLITYLLLPNYVTIVPIFKTENQNWSWYSSATVLQLAEPEGLSSSDIVIYLWVHYFVSTNHEALQPRRFFQGALTRFCTQLAH